MFRRFLNFLKISTVEWTLNCFDCERLEGKRKGGGRLYWYLRLSDKNVSRKCFTEYHLQLYATKCINSTNSSVNPDFGNSLKTGEPLETLEFQCRSRMGSDVYIHFLFFKLFATIYSGTFQPWHRLPPPGGVSETRGTGSLQAGSSTSAQIHSHHKSPQS